MKGQLAMQYSDNVGQYSDLKVMHSAAGYYIGTTYTGEDGLTEPGSRESQYFRTWDEANKALKDNNWCQRDMP